MALLADGLTDGQAIVAAIVAAATLAGGAVWMFSRKLLKELLGDIVRIKADTLADKEECRKEIESIKSECREEKREIRTEMGKKFDAINRATTALEDKLETIQTQNLMAAEERGALRAKIAFYEQDKS